MITSHQSVPFLDNRSILLAPFLSITSEQQLAAGKTSDRLESLNSSPEEPGSSPLLVFAINISDLYSNQTSLVLYSLMAHWFVVRSRNRGVIFLCQNLKNSHKMASNMDEIEVVLSWLAEKAALNIFFSSMNMTNINQPLLQFLCQRKMTLTWCIYQSVLIG